MSEQERTVVVSRVEEFLQPGTRRRFLRSLGLGGAIVLLPSVFAACDNDDDKNNGTNCTTDPTGPGCAAAVTLNLNSDVGIFNFAFALEQLEAAFYSAVVSAANFSTLVTSAEERELLTDIRNHEVVHREFFRRALGTAAIADLALNTTTVASAISTRANILATARSFEDLGVAAYNGAGKYLTNPNNLLVAGKIVSVEARHAAAIRDVLDATGTAFAGDDVVNANGLDVKAEPGAVRTRVIAANVVTTTINVGAGPTEPATTDQLPPA